MQKIVLESSKIKQIFEKKHNLETVNFSNVLKGYRQHFRFQKNWK